MSAVEKHETPLAEATTPSLEALKPTAALKVHASSGAMASLFRRATEIDPNFAMAHVWLGRTHADLDESDLAAESTTTAWQLRDRTSDRENLWITAAHQMLVTGNLEKARQTCEAWLRTYPRDPAPHQLLSGMINKSAGRYEEAADEAQKAIARDPDFAIGYYSLGVNNAYLGRLEEADKAVERAVARGLEINEFLMLGYDVAFLRGDQAGMDHEAARARARSGAANWISGREAFALAYSGHLDQAREKSRRACLRLSRPHSGKGRVCGSLGKQCERRFRKLARSKAESHGSTCAIKGSRGGVWRRLRARSVGRFFPIRNTRE